MKLIKTLLFVALATSNGWTSGDVKDELFFPLTKHDISPLGINLGNDQSELENAEKNPFIYTAIEINKTRIAAQEQINQQNTKISELEKTIEQQNARISFILKLFSE